jgi:virginiamycin B lyase
MAAGLVIGAVLWSPSATAEPVGLIEHFPTKCGIDTLVPGPDGNVWFTCFRKNLIAGGKGKVGRITPQGEVAEFGAGIAQNSVPGDIVVGPDGNLWFTDNSGDYLHPRAAIGRVTPEGTITVFSDGLREKSLPTEIIAGPDGNLWFTDAGSPPEIGRITPQGAITEFRLDLNSVIGVGGLAAGADGNLWFTQVFALPHGDKEPGGLIGRLTPSGASTQFGATSAAIGAPVAGPDGNVWFIDASKSPAIDRVTSSGEISQFSDGLNGLPLELVDGPDGNLWFTVQRGIGRITPDGKISEFTHCLNYRQLFSGPQSIVAGPDGNLWFTSVTSRSLPSIAEPPTIGRITPSGEVTQFRAGLKSEPRSIVAGPDGRVWFSGGAEQIERITPPSAPVNTFIFGRPGQARANGSVLVPVEVPDPGALELRQLALVLPHKRTIKLPNRGPITASAASCGSTLLRLQLKGAAKARLLHRGRIQIKVGATFTPNGGTANSREAIITVRKHRHRR